MAGRKSPPSVDAYVSGFGASQRIVLWDTALKGLKRDEILFVMGHEMGHYVLGHMWKYLAVVSLGAFAAFWACAQLAGALVRRFGAQWGVEGVSDLAAMPALFLSLKALDLPRGAKVLIPAFTFAAVPSAVVHADCVPVLVEVGEDYRVDMADFEAKLYGADAVLISHMRGHTSDMDAIMALCDARDIPVIEDAAHSLGR